MFLEAYRKVVYEAVLRDWEALAGETGRLNSILDECESATEAVLTTDGGARRSD